MYCQNCGAANTENTRFCANCGSQIGNIQATNVNQPINAPQINAQYNDAQNTYLQNQNMYNPIMTKEEFSVKFLSKNSNSWVKALWIICFVTSVLAVASLGMGNVISIIDIVFYLVFGILIKKKPDWKFALIVTCYSGFVTVLSLALSGVASGLFALVAGINAIRVLKKLDNAYKNYTTTGILPTEML